jgi:hypothetical protein
MLGKPICVTERERESTLTLSRNVVEGILINKVNFSFYKYPRVSLVLPVLDLPAALPDLACLQLLTASVSFQECTLSPGSKNR